MAPRVPVGLSVEGFDAVLVDDRPDGAVTLIV
jgi:hypothetical protein